MQNFITLGQHLLGEKYVAQKRKKKIIPNIVDTLFRSNAQGQRTHSARANLSFYRKNIIIIMLNKYKMTKLILLKIIRNQFCKERMTELLSLLKGHL